MASIRTQKEIRQRAPIWLVCLLFANLTIMAVDARDNVTKQRLFRVWAQALFSPVQSASSRAGGAGSGLIQRIINFNSTANENEELQKRLASLELQLNNSREALSENARLKELLDLKDKPGPEQVAA